MTTTTNQLRAELEAQQALDRDTFLAVSQMNFGNRFEEDELRGQRDPRTGRFIKHQDFGADDQLLVTFTSNAVLNKLKSYHAGSPKYDDMDFITILIPGNKDLTYHGPVTDFHEWRFPREYEAYKAGKDHVDGGTPLSHWPEVTPAQIKELDYFGVRTVEQIANLSDSSSGVLRGFYSMKERARVFLDVAAKNNAAGLLNMQLQEQEAKHADEMAALNAKLERLMSLMDAKPAADEVEVTEAPAPKKR